MVVLFTSRSGCKPNIAFTGAADSVCGLRSSCCTASGEEFFGYQAASKFQETVTRYSDTFMDQCPYNSKMAGSVQFCMTIILY